MHNFIETVFNILGVWTCRENVTTNEEDGGCDRCGKSLQLARCRVLIVFHLKNKTIVVTFM